MERIVEILSFVLSWFKRECSVTTTTEWGADNLAKCNSGIVSLSKGGDGNIQLLENYTNYIHEWPWTRSICNECGPHFLLLPSQTTRHFGAHSATRYWHIFPPSPHSSLDERRVWKLPSGTLRGIWYTAGHLQVFHVHFHEDATRGGGLVRRFTLGRRAWKDPDQPFARVGYKE